MKLVVNAWFGIQVAALGELLGLADSAGIDPERVREILTGLPVTSPALKGVAGQIAVRAYAPLFPIELVAKDFDYVRALAMRSGARLPMTEAGAAVYNHAIVEGFGNLNISGVAALYQEASVS